MRCPCLGAVAAAVADSQLRLQLRQPRMRPGALCQDLIYAWDVTFLEPTQSAACIFSSAAALASHS